MRPIKIHPITRNFLSVVAGLWITLSLFRSDIFYKSLPIWVDYFMFFLPFMVAIIALIGLFDAYVPPELVAKHLGKGAGMRGYFLAMLLGSVVAASEYAIFPTMAILKSKGAKSSILAVFLVCWSGLSIPIIPLEVDIFGIKFAALRMLLIVIGGLGTGLLTEFTKIKMVTE